MARAPANLLLDSLSPNVLKTVLSLGKHVELPVRTSLYQPNQTPPYGYFIVSGIASEVVSFAEGGTVEVGLVGPEGLAGCFHLLDDACINTDCFIQIKAAAFRVPLPALRRLFGASEEFRSCILQYVQRQTVVLAQIAACNKLHEAEARLARWLLMVRDRTGSDSFALTQEFIAEMLGTRRTTVAVVAGILQRAGLLEYKRGRVHILDRERVEAAACECYKVVHETFPHIS